ncbi:MAG: hypothetical protein GY930_04650 [bacterium]|nr:hypothetical protein [bacterium]
MERPPENRPPFSDPGDPGRSETHAGSPNDPPSSETLHQRLAHWDELSELDLDRMQADPEANAKLKRLRDAQAWLENSLLDQQDCPTPEELFALAMPFAGESLPMERCVEIQEHLKLCAACKAESQTLETPPPSPLLLDAPEDLGLPLPVGQKQTPLRRMRALIACCAALMLVWLLGGRNLFPSSNPVNAAGDTWPSTTTLRGTGDSHPISPSGKTLARGADETWTGQITWAPVVDAQSYRVLVTRNNGSAFDTGAVVVDAAATGTSLDATTPLTTGHYNVELFVTVFGLESPLGNAEFQVMAAPEVQKELEWLKGIERVNFLHERAWRADAVLEALDLPASPERTRYLKAMENR